MRKFFEKKYEWSEFLEYSCAPNMNFICISSCEKRAESTTFIEDMRNKGVCNIISIDYHYDGDAITFRNKEYNLKQHLYEFVNMFDKNIPLLINITAMDIRLLGALLYNVKKLHFSKIYCMYSEPLKYRKRVKRDSSECVDRFDLYKRFRGIQPIPGYLRANDDNLEEKWVAFLGFDGKRAEQISDRYDFHDIVPVITLPSFQPGWHNYALQENLDLIRSNGRKPEYIVANSFLSAYDYLQKMKEAYPDSYLRITPLGTKVNALGVLLFSLNHQDGIEILYDNPIEEGEPTIDRGRTYVFDISDVINS